MIVRLVALAMLLMGALTALPVASERLTERIVSADEAARWRGVGSLRVAGLPSCTAFLISAYEAITAAHCVVDRESGRRVMMEYFVLVLGQRDTGYAAWRKVTDVAFLPGFLSRDPVTVPDALTDDLALLQLDRPVTAEEAAPLQVADWADPVGALVDIVGFERGGPKTATIREGCLGVETGQGVTTVNCDLITGLSGSPVLLQSGPDAPPRLVASVSSRGQHGGVAFVVAIAPRLAELRGLIAK